MKSSLMLMTLAAASTAAMHESADDFNSLEPGQRVSMVSTNYVTAGGESLPTHLMGPFVPLVELQLSPFLYSLRSPTFRSLAYRASVANPYKYLVGDHITKYLGTPKEQALQEVENSI